MSTEPVVRTRDAQRTKDAILAVATSEFANSGYAGGRVDEIAARTATTKRMIYYYFGSKQGLYLAVMEAACAVIRRLERELDVEELDPVAALRSLAESTYEHHTSHRDFVRLVAIENVHKAEHIKDSPAIRDLNSTAVQTLEMVLDRGIAAGLFRRDLDALDVHMMISAYSIFHVANRYTFRVLFDRDLLASERHDGYRRLAGEMIVATMTSGTEV
ncbi:TetR/AcrR family transcriptional regulator [soil metagenome]